MSRRVSGWASAMLLSFSADFLPRVRLANNLDVQSSASPLPELPGACAGDCLRYAFR